MISLGAIRRRPIARFVGIMFLFWSGPASAQEVVDDVLEPPPHVPMLPYRSSADPLVLDPDPQAGQPIDTRPDAVPPVGDIASEDDKVCYRIGSGEMRLCKRGPISNVAAGVNYYQIEPGTLPWQAQTFVQSVSGDWQRQHWCGGSSIGGGWILTAAHCTRDGAGAMHDVRVRLGAFDLAKGDGAIYRIDRVIVHADYQRGNKPNDIALLHVVPERRPRVAPVYRIASIPLSAPATGSGERLRIGQNVHTSGWGRTSYKGKLRETLGETQLKLTANAQCKALFGDKFSNRALCAYAPGTDSCEGDSGGPLTEGYAPKDRRLIGIVSFGRGCAQPGIPGVYTRVDAYFDWIQMAKLQTGRFVRLPDPVTRQSAR